MINKTYSYLIRVEVHQCHECAIIKDDGRKLLSIERRQIIQIIIGSTFRLSHQHIFHLRDLALVSRRHLLKLVLCVDICPIIISCISNNKIDFSTYLSDSQYVLIPHVVMNSTLIIIIDKNLLIQLGIAISIIDTVRNPYHVLGNRSQKLSEVRFMLHYFIWTTFLLRFKFVLQNWKGCIEWT